MNGPRERTDLDAIRGRFDAAVADHPPFGAESAFLDHAAEDVAALLGEFATVKAERDQAREELAALNGRRILSVVFGHHKGAPRPFALYRRPPARKPQSLVALGAEFPDGAVALRLANDGGWTTKSDGGAETIAANSFDAALEIVWLSDELPALAEMEAALEASEAREAAVRPVVEAACQLIAADRRLRERTAAMSGKDLRDAWTVLIAAVDALPAAEEVAPRVWAMPSEPGPDVTRVRDVYGQRFERADAIDENGSEPGWLGDAFTDEADVPDLFLSWKTLMAHHAPLTEVVDAPPTEEATNA